jgi:hypothetical protein
VAEPKGEELEVVAKDAPAAAKADAAEVTV